ncbi:MAG: winged helix-turn-helix transcriptional regulator [Promethearchaeota archaeon]
MKSIVFVMLKEELLSGLKCSTFRTVYIPKYEKGEIVKIQFRADGKKEFLFYAEILDFYPKMIYQITLQEAKWDGFNSVNDFIKTIKKLNPSIKNSNMWGFYTKFKKVKPYQIKLIDKRMRPAKERIFDFLKKRGKEETTAKEIQEILGFSTATINTNLNKLLDEGLIFDKYYSWNHRVWSINKLK